MDTHSPFPRIDQEIGKALFYLTNFWVRFSETMPVELFLSKNIHDLPRILFLWDNDVTGSFEVNEKNAILGAGATINVQFFFGLQDIRSHR